jgi:hypothetical protein
VEAASARFITMAQGDLYLALPRDLLRHPARAWSFFCHAYPRCADEHDLIAQINLPNSITDVAAVADLVNIRNYNVYCVVLTMAR